MLFENPDATSPLNHLGVELGSTTEVGEVAARFADAGLEHTRSVVDRCCHAVQDKVWVEVPDVPLGAWEFYTVLDDDPGASGADDTDAAGACCAGGSTDEAPCCGAGAGSAGAALLRQGAGGAAEQQTAGMVTVLAPLAERRYRRLR